MQVYIANIYIVTICAAKMSFENERIAKRAHQLMQACFSYYIHTNTVLNLKDTWIQGYLDRLLKYPWPMYPFDI